MDPHHFLPDPGTLRKLLIPDPTEYPISVDTENPSYVPVLA